MPWTWAFSYLSPSFIEVSDNPTHGIHTHQARIIRTTHTNTLRAHTFEAYAIDAIFMYSFVGIFVVRFVPLRFYHKWCKCVRIVFFCLFSQLSFYLFFSICSLLAFGAAPIYLLYTRCRYTKYKHMQTRAHTVSDVCLLFIFFYFDFILFEPHIDYGTVNIYIQFYTR